MNLNVPLNSIQQTYWITIDHSGHYRHPRCVYRLNFNGLINFSGVRFVENYRVHSKQKHSVTTTRLKISERYCRSMLKIARLKNGRSDKTHSRKKPDNFRTKTRVAWTGSISRIISRDILFRPFPTIIAISNCLFISCLFAVAINGRFCVGATPNAYALKNTAIHGGLHD